ncbi:hypothetical protein UA08_04424 [Talaromyces atroroseus]|uniref:Uncharacterized protein n=1 Tax=Talaromyces atroroseus TaxID=1441469 RepID=A0A1Q5Q8V9_TALAT|nr:hypothetical protein UA08_04424 [Talaromyces atroroseus]OKL60459.1 hypothetical protein UA08_04424 [Talaromyces atroroseus]
MANHNEKSETERKAQRRRDKRTERRFLTRNNINNTSSSSSENEAPARMPQTNGKPSSAAAPILDHNLRDAIVKLLSAKETFVHLSHVVGLLEYVRGSAACAALTFQPEIELKAENERLRHTVNEFKQVIEQQKVQELTARCHTLEAAISDQQDLQRKADREQQHLINERQKLDSERAQMKAELTGELEKKKKEYQAGFQKKLKDAERNIERLEKSNRDLEAKKQKAHDQLENLKAGNEALMSQVRELKSELHKEKEKFLVESRGIDFYQDKFEGLRQELERLIVDHITGPMNDDQINSVEREHLEDQEVFKFVPKRRTPVAQYLWRRGAQSYIISQLCGRVWQSFPFHEVNESTLPNKSKAAFDAISDKLKDINAENEAVWRSITYKAMSRLSAEISSSKAEEEEKDIARHVVKTLAPIIAPSNKESFEAKLGEIVREASSLWAAVKTDKLRISLSEQPPSQASPEQSWLPGSLDGSLEEVESPQDISISHARSLCLFPAVKASDDASKEDIVIQPGYALFSDSTAFALGNKEQQEYAREERELRYNLRRNSATSQLYEAAQNKKVVEPTS